MAAPTSTNEVTARKFSSSISALWTKIKSTFQTLGNLVTAWGSTPADTKYPSEKLVKDSLDGKSNTDHTHSNLVPEGDNRNVATEPNDYNNKFIFKGIKNKTVIGSPSDDTFSYLFGLRGCANSTGGKAHELAFNGSGIFTRRGGTTTWDAWEKIITSKDFNSQARTIPQDVSKGANLVVNGSGRMSSNYNFSHYLYVPTIANGGSAGSFGFNGTDECDEYISCDFNKKIVFSVDVKNLATQPNNCTHRIFVHEYDIDKKSVAAFNVMFGVGTLTELTQDLNPGDTVVHLADLSNANWLSTTNYHHGFIFWNYTNSYGYLYPPETYSRNVYPSSGDSSSLWEVENVNVSAGTITLNTPWAGPAIPAGTKVSRRQSGNTYPYPASATISDTEWHTLKGSLQGITAPGTSERGSKFSQGTAFIRVGLYPTSLTNADETIGKRAVFANLAMYEEQDFADGFGVLPVASGGTGRASVTSGYYLVGNGTNALTEKTPNAAANNLINALTTGDSTPTDNDYYVAQYAGGGTTTNTFHRRPVKALWEYIKGKISSVLGLTATSYGGNAETATALSAGDDRTKLDGIELNANNYTHPTSGANTSKGDTTAQTPSFGQTFKVLSATVDAMGHTTALAEHTVKIPDSVAEGGPGGNSGLMSYQDKDRLDLMSDEANKAEASTNNGNIKIDGVETTVYTHPTSGANTSKGDTAAQTPGFGQTFKALSATVDSLGHTTSLAEHTVKIPNDLATGGPSGGRGLMSSADKDRLDLARVNVISTFFGTRSYTPVQYLANYVGDVGNWSNADNYDTSLLRVGDVVKFYVTVPLMANAHFIIDVKLDTEPGANAERVHGMTLAMYQADPHEPLDGAGSDADNFVIPGHYTIRNVTQITNKWPGSTAGDSDYTNLIVSRMVPNDVDIGSSSAYAINQLVLWRRRYLARDRYKSGNNWVWGAWQQFTYQDSNYAATGNVNRPVYVDENGMIKPCTYTWIVGSLGSASNTIYFT